MYSLHSDPSGVILDESQSGRTINVQRGFYVDRNKASHKEETEINSGDSSSMQKTRHHSSSSSNVGTSETRRIQLSSTGDKPDVLVTTYTQNTSGTSSLNTGDLSAGNRGVLFHQESGGYGGSGTLGGGFRNGDDSTLASRYPDLGEHSETFENRWGETSVSEGQTDSSLDTPGTEVDDSQSVYEEELRRVQEDRLQRQREQEERLTLLRQREEQESLLYQRRQQEEQRRQQEEETRRRQGEERRRLQEEEIRKRQEQERRRLQEEAYKLEQERRYSTSGVRGGHSESSEDGFITGDREETVRGGDFSFHLRNVSSAQEFERVFGSLSKSATGYQLYNRQGRHYVQFMGRFRTSADRKEYIEFQDGTMFPLQDRYGGQSYASESTEARDSRFLSIDGDLLVDSSAKGYIVLKDGRRFPLLGSFSYTEERTYTLGDPRGTQQSGRSSSDYKSKGYSRSWDEEPGHTAEMETDYESKYSSTHEERRTEDRRVTSRVYGRDNLRETREEDATTSASNTGAASRFKRESDMVDVGEFKRFEKHRRRPRDLEEDPMAPDSEVDENMDYGSNLGTQKLTSPCDTGKCVMLRCVLGPLKKDQEVWIGARYRVDARTLKKVAVQEKVRVSTKLVARVTKQPFIGAPAEQVIKSHEIKTNVEPSVTPSVPDVIPLWVVVLSACAGAIILLLLIFLLHKVCLCILLKKYQLIR